MSEQPPRKESTATRRGRDEREPSRAGFLIALFLLGAGLVWLAIILVFGLPKYRHSATRTLADENMNIDTGVRSKETPRRVIPHVFNSLEGRRSPFTTLLAAFALALIGAAGLLRRPFLSVVASVYLGLWWFGVILSLPFPVRPPPPPGGKSQEAAVEAEQETGSGEVVGAGAAVIEMAVGLAGIMALVLLHRFAVRGTVRYLRWKKNSVKPDAAADQATVMNTPGGVGANLAVDADDEKTARKNPVLSAKNVHRSFRDGLVLREVLKGVDIETLPGEIVAILGHSGSGKSTLLHILGLLDTATEGEVFIGGKSTGSMSESERDRLRSRTVGFVFQFFHLMPEFDVLENVVAPSRIAGLYSEKRRGDAIRLLKRVGLGDRVNQDIKTLSGGERQRVAIARALINNPEVLLCDEPTGNLDSATGELIMQLLLDLRRDTGLAVVLVTHDKYLTKKADKVYSLKDGRLTPCPV